MSHNHDGKERGPGRAGMRIRILDLPVDALTMEEAVERICRAWEGEQPFHVVTANLEILYSGLKDREMARLLDGAELVTADGAGVLLAARIGGLSLPARVAGFDLMMNCLREAAQHAAPVFFLGAQPEVLTSALTRAKELFPGLQIAGSHHGYFSDGEAEAVAAEIRARQPRLLCVALGAPRQEKWIFHHKGKLPPCVAIGVGGSFDVLAGRTRRAPRWMQQAGLEWLYRLLRQPSRLRRVSVIPIFLLMVLWQRLKGL